MTPLSGQGSAPEGDLEAETQTAVAFLRRLRAFSEEAFVRPPGGSMAVFVAQREKGETERSIDGNRRERSGRVGEEIHRC